MLHTVKKSTGLRVSRCGFRVPALYWLTWGESISVWDPGEVWDFPHLSNEGDHLKELLLVLQSEEAESHS